MSRPGRECCRLKTIRDGATGVNGDMGNMFDRAHGLHIFSGGFWFSRLVVKALSEGSASIEIAEEDWPVVNGVEAAFFRLDDPDRLADERRVSCSNSSRR